MEHKLLNISILYLRALGYLPLSRGAKWREHKKPKGWRIFGASLARGGLPCAMSNFKHARAPAPGPPAAALGSRTCTRRRLAGYVAGASTHDGVLPLDDGVSAAQHAVPVQMLGRGDPTRRAGGDAEARGGGLRRGL